MNEQERTKISKFLSLVLRHQPEKIGLTLDQQGWVTVEALLRQSAAHGLPLDLVRLQEVMATNEKKRFAFSADGSMIRASQGHSVPVDLAYPEATPPPILYHGTAVKNLAAILQQGLLKQGRHHVHLSAERETATAVGKRYGKPVVLQVLAGAMHAEGFLFYQAANGVWLTDHVPAKFLRQI